MDTHSTNHEESLNIINNGVEARAALGLSDNSIPSDTESAVSPFDNIDIDSKPDNDHWSPDNFYKLLSATIEIDDTSVALIAINSFVRISETEYLEIDSAAGEQTNLLLSIEVEISKFIEHNQRINRLSVLGISEAEVLVLIYNEQNLLAFAQDTAQRNAAGITTETLEMIYRYRTVVRRIQEVIEKNIAIGQQQGTEPRTPSQANAWAGEVREYGYNDQGRIRIGDYRAFSDVPEEEEERPVIIGDTEVKLVLRKRFDE